MRLRAHTLQVMRDNPDFLPLSLTDNWESRPDDNGETHCWGCGVHIFVGDRCLVRYFEYTSVTFCLDCYRDNESVMWEWVRPEDRPPS